MWYEVIRRYKRSLYSSRLELLAFLRRRSHAAAVAAIKKTPPDRAEYTWATSRSDPSLSPRCSRDLSYIFYKPNRYTRWHNIQHPFISCPNNGNFYTSPSRPFAYIRQCEIYHISQNCHSIANGIYRNDEGYVIYELVFSSTLIIILFLIVLSIYMIWLYRRSSEKIP
jgi:hypothetical protein